MLGHFGSGRFLFTKHLPRLANASVKSCKLSTSRDSPSAFLVGRNRRLFCNRPGGASNPNGKDATSGSTKKQNAAGMTKEDVIGYLVVFVLSSAYLLNEVKDLPDPKPKEKKPSEETKA
mmetsp:Transcript_9615/g.11552  ORF Transcript_9615/g.11552 Transcript_9615/m.11552 type:complete len:119 (-) Transcript_9615:959-1315(-)